MWLPQCQRGNPEEYRWINHINSTFDQQDAPLHRLPINVRSILPFIHYFTSCLFLVWSQNQKGGCLQMMMVVSVRDMFFSISLTLAVILIIALLNSLTIYELNCSEGTSKYISTFYHFSTLRWHKLLKSYLVEVNEAFIAHSQYHGSWWPCNARSLGINSHSIDLVLPEYYGLSSGSV